MNKLFLTLVVALFGALVAPTPVIAQADGTTELEKKLDAIDLADADELCEVALWAMRHKDRKVRREGRKLMKEVLELDEEHEDARKALGHVRVGEKWYTSAKSAEKAKKKLLEVEMKENGFVKYKGGWIKPEDRRKWKRGKWKQDDNGVWKSEADVMREKGYVKYQGVWLKLSEQDRKLISEHRDLTGDDILIVTTKYFSLRLTVTPKFMEEYSKLVDDVYDWHAKEFRLEVPGGRSLWPRTPHMWGFDNIQQFQDWLTNYKEDPYELTKESVKAFRENPGGWINTNPKQLVSTNTQKKDADIKNGLIHNVSHFIFTWQTLGQRRPWLSEAVANLTEHQFAGNGLVSCSTLSRYGGNGGVAEKAFNTKDGPAQVKALVRSGDFTPIDELAKKDLNSLNSDDLATGWSMVEWMFNRERDRFIVFINAIRENGNQAQAFAKAFDGKTPTEVQELWRQYVRKRY